MKVTISIIAWAILIFFVIQSIDTLPDAETWENLVSRRAVEAFLAFAAAFSLALVLRTYRFGFLIRRLAPIPWHDIALSFPWLFLIGAVTPFRLGEGMRGVWARERNIPISSTLSYWVVERVCDLMALGVITVVGFALATSSTVSSIYIALLLGLAVLAYGVLWSFHNRIAALLAKVPKIGTGLGNMVLGFSFMRDSSLHLRVVAVTGLIWAVMVIGFAAAFTIYLAEPLPLTLALAATGAVNFAALLSGAPGNLGAFQAAVVACFIAYGLPAENGLMASFIPQSAGLLTILLVGSIGRLLIALKGVPRF
jgi:uncharacterized membrane protein YbhN (UPF0104 family)